MSVVDRWSTVQRTVLLGGRFDLCPDCTERALAKPVVPSPEHRPEVTITDVFYGERTYLVYCHQDQAAFGSWEDAMLFANAHAATQGLTS